MKLNEQVPGMPPWPPIYKLEDGSYKVRARHVSHLHYRFSRWIMNCITVWYFFHAWNIVLHSHAKYLSTGLWQFVKLFIPYLFAVLVLPVPRWFCFLVLPRITTVHFLPNMIRINGKNFTTEFPVTIQFRANRIAISETRYQWLETQKHRAHLPYEMKFRLVEMIYGSRLVPIASVADEDRAQQFALALQIGYELMKAEHVQEATRITISRQPVRDLPE